jgi:hypothetical protein
MTTTRSFQATRNSQRAILVIGSGKSSGKTTAAASLTQVLVRRGMGVTACKLTGSVSSYELAVLRAAGAHDVRDFSCYGFPSTYAVGKQELLKLFETMLRDACRSDPQVVIFEVADGILQRETRMLLEEADVRRRILGVLVAATCAPSALYSVAQLARLGHDVIGVSGVMTSSMLSMDEFACRSNVPVASSADDGDELARLVLRRLVLARYSATRRADSGWMPSFMESPAADAGPSFSMTRAEPLTSEAA